MASLGLCYVRFMDDVLVLAPTRWTLGRVVRARIGRCEMLASESRTGFQGRYRKSFGAALERSAGWQSRFRGPPLATRRFASFIRPL